MEISTTEFFIQLGPEFLAYKQIFIENEFRDSSSLRAMDVNVDLDVMFTDPPLPLGHKRKIQMAVKNLNQCNVTGTTNTSEATTHDESLEEDLTRSSMSKMKVKIMNDLKAKENEKADLVHKRRSFEVAICEPEPVGPSKGVRCGNCHLRGHKADGNRGMKQCSLPVCRSWKDCGQKDRHPEYKRDVKQLDRDIKSIDKEIEEMKGEATQLDTYKENSDRQFISIIKERLRTTNPSKYLNTNVLMRDVIVLKDFYKNKIPVHPKIKDRDEFSYILENRQNKKMTRYSLSDMPDTIKSSYEDISEDEMPSKKSKFLNHSSNQCTPSQTITNESQSQQLSEESGWMKRNMYSLNSGIYGYGFNPYFGYYPQYSYQSSTGMYGTHPPLPKDPPPTNPPLPESD